MINSIKTVCNKVGSACRSAAKAVFSKKKEKSANPYKKGMVVVVADKLKKQIPLTVFIAILFLLVLFSGMIDSEKIQNDGDVFLAVAAIEIVVFVLPAMMFCRYRGMEFIKKTNLRLHGISKLPFVFFVLLFMIFSNVLITLLIFSGSSPVDASDATIRMPRLEGGDIIGVILTFAVIPAICEEFVFRCVLMSEFEKHGHLTSIIITSLLFAMVHFSPEGFLLYFFSGLILGFTAYVTRSVAASMVLHGLYNIYGLFLESELWGAISRNVNIVLVVFIAVVIVLVSMMVALGEAHRMFLDYSITGVAPPVGYINREEVENAGEKIKRRRIRAVLSFFTPGVLVALGIFIYAVWGR